MKSNIQTKNIYEAVIKTVASNVAAKTEKEVPKPMVKTLMMVVEYQGLHINTYYDRMITYSGI